MRAFLRPYRGPLSLAGALAVTETAIGLAQLRESPALGLV
jgi:hypothetical protein